MSFGAWRSPITTKLITQSALRLGAVRVAGSHIIWKESRPLEGGRGVLCRATITNDGLLENTIDLTPPDFNVRTLVHEYGGGDFLISEKAIFFSNMKDQRIYKQEMHANGVAEPTPVTPDGLPLRFADFIIDVTRNRLIAVIEDHSKPNPKDVINYIGAIDLDLSESTTTGITPLIQGEDFYASPTLSSDGSSLAYISWKHPMMPWDETRLSVSSILTNGTVGETRIVAGQGGAIDAPQSIMAPIFSPFDNKLYFTTDTTGWWSIHREENAGGTCVPLCNQKGVEFGSPAWQLGAQPYVFLEDGNLLCTFGGPGIDGGDQLGLLNPSLTTPTLNTIAMPEHGALGNVACGNTTNGKLVISLVGGSSSTASSVKTTVVNASNDLLDTNNTLEWKIARSSTDVSIDTKYLSSPEKIEFPTENGRTSHMYYYPPTNGDELPTTNALPPLLVKSHGGPTSSTSSAFSLSIQFWTSRGIAVADVNYGGSTGYGKEYRQRLTSRPLDTTVDGVGSWGIVDVDDCTNAAKFLSSAGKVDPKRMAISGGSAGGFTTLACLAFRNVFSAGASHYGIGNLEALAADTHKFESRYLDRLVGEYPKNIEVYKKRSPINSVDDFSCPLIQFQGLDDKVVPPNQALEVFDALKKKGLDTTCVLFEGEQHGFRRAANIRRALDTELEFYGQVFGFTPILPKDHVELTMGEKVVVGIGGNETKKSTL